ncbi:MAG: uncharacterized protein PWQ35_621 [Patescibacteria group bacterium]|nr:uncharacterized protein [Patescibacteria group bacterium]
MKKTNAIITALGIIALATVLSLAFYFTNQRNNEDRFSVTGSGTVYAKADIANLTIGIKTEVKKTAAEATSENNEKMKAIIATIKELGVEEKDIKTTNYSLRPSYKWTEERGQELVGYEVSQEVTLKIRDLEKIGEIIGKTTAKGANQVGNINFTIDDEFELKNQARALAIEKAKQKAQLIASQSGIKLGKIKGVNETNYQPGPIVYSNAKMDFAVEEAGNVVSPSIETGTNEIRAEVTLIYEVK